MRTMHRGSRKHATPNPRKQRMSEAPTTQVSLLIRIRDGGNHTAWREFAQMYGPVIYGFARKRGLQDADAADLMQEVLRSVSGAIQKLEYDRNQGTFRGWLFTITRNKVLNFHAARKIRPQAAADSQTARVLNEKPEASNDNEVWELEYQRRLAQVAMEHVRGEFQENTWRAFHLVAVEGVAASEAAKIVQMTPGAIYVAKSRILARLKSEIEALQRLEDQ
jgi:RNA polymerase sigma factor (sigma-70 family)